MPKGLVKLRLEDKIVVPKTLVSARRLPEPPALIHCAYYVPKRMIVDTDNHFEICDLRWQEGKLKFAQDMKIDGWFNLGDNYDFHFLSRFDKDPYRGQVSIQKEFDSANWYWDEVCRLSKSVNYILGNHEYRLHKFIEANTGIFGLRALEDFGKLAGLPDKVKVYPYGSHVKVGHVWGEHGDQIKGSNQPKWVLDNRQGRIRAFGHYHRANMATMTCLDGDTGKEILREAYNVGHGSEGRYQRYAGTVKNWQKGFLFVEHFTTGGILDATVHHIKAGSSGAFSWQGKVYSANRSRK